MSNYPSSLPGVSSSSFTASAVAGVTSKVYASGRPRIDRRKLNVIEGASEIACNVSLGFTYTFSEYNEFYAWFTEGISFGGSFDIALTELLTIKVYLRGPITKLRLDSGWQVTITGISPLSSWVGASSTLIVEAKTIPAKILPDLPAPSFGRNFDSVLTALVSPDSDNLPQYRRITEDKFVTTELSFDLDFNQWCFLLRWYETCLAFGTIPFELDAKNLALGSIGSRASGKLLATALAPPRFEGQDFHGRASLQVSIRRQRKPPPKWVKVGENIWWATKDLAIFVPGNYPIGGQPLCLEWQGEYYYNVNVQIEYALDAFYAVMPAGWELPSFGDWQNLVDYFGGTSVAGEALKATEFGGTNSSGLGIKAAPSIYMEYGTTTPQYPTNAVSTTFSATPPSSPVAYTVSRMVADQLTCTDFTTASPVVTLENYHLDTYNRLRVIRRTTPPDDEM